MKISALNNSCFNYNRSVNTFKSNFNKISLDGMNGEKLVMKGKAFEYFNVTANVSDKKVGSKFIIQPKSPQFQDLRILITPESSIVSKDSKNPLSVSIEKNSDKNDVSFKGTLYGSIRKNSDGKADTVMQNEYARFFSEGMYRSIVKNVSPSNIINDYNFFIPSDGDGTRYRDITALQGGVTKPASYIPAYINGKQMSLVQGVITNFAKTGKLYEKYDFINVIPAQGSAYAFLEGLKNGQIPVNKPIVFSWGDNFSDIDVKRLIQNHEKSGSDFTVTVIPVEKNQTKSLSIIKPLSLKDKSIKEFVEKPQDDNFIESCAIVENGKKQYLSAVGPYIISACILQWIKDRYTQHPESFKNPDKGYDFSSMVIGNVLNAINNNELYKDNLTKPMVMRYDVIKDTETWSDLGSQKDFSNALKQISDGLKVNINIFCPK